MINHAGDFVTWPVLTALEELAPVEAVAGNMDPHEITSRLPAKKTVRAAGFKIGIVHGYGAPRVNSEASMRPWASNRFHSQRASAFQCQKREGRYAAMSRAPV